MKERLPIGTTVFFADDPEYASFSILSGSISNYTQEGYIELTNGYSLNQNEVYTDPKELANILLGGLEDTIERLNCEKCILIEWLY